uniref:hypothetical protein n=1 Tax=Altererythrobacter segetis TaxID=1104773 RepID=UPI00140AE78A|nr:hypothetical protein [Altererythrobacter segetis]
MTIVFPFADFFVGSALAVRFLIAWQWPFFFTMPFPNQFDFDAIYGHMKRRVFTRTWIIWTLVAAAIFAGGWVSRNEYVAIPLLAASVSIATFVSFAVTYKLFYGAVAALGLTYPPPSEDRR